MDPRSRPVSIRAAVTQVGRSLSSFAENTISHIQAGSNTIASNISHAGGVIGAGVGTGAADLAALAGFRTADHSVHDDDDEDDDDYCEEDLDDEDFAPTMEGPIMVKDWDEGDFFPCYGKLIREHVYIYHIDDGTDADDDSDHKGGGGGGADGAGNKDKERELFETIDVRRVVEVVESNGTLTILPGAGAIQLAADTTDSSASTSDSPLPVVCVGPQMDKWHTALLAAVKNYGAESIIKQGWMTKLQPYRSSSVAAAAAAATASSSSAGAAAAAASSRSAADKRRYVLLSKNFLRYYKSEDILVPPLASVNLIQSEVEGAAAVPGNQSNSVILIRNGHRLLYFECANPQKMEAWLEAVRQMKIDAKLAAEAAALAAYERNVDERIRLYDRGDNLFYLKALAGQGQRLEDADSKDSGADGDHDSASSGVPSCIGDVLGLKTMVFNELQQLYVIPIESGDGRYNPKLDPKGNVRLPDTIQEHLKLADRVVEYLAKAIPAVQKGPFIPRARYDVLSVLMTTINNFLDRYMLPWITDLDSREMASAKTTDVYDLIVWMRKYQNAIRFVYCPIYIDPSLGTNSTAGKRSNVRRSVGAPQRRVALIGGEGASISSMDIAQRANDAAKNAFCEIFGELPSVCKRYLDGYMAGSGRPDAVDGAATHLATTCINIWERIVKDPDSAIQRNNDGTFYTQAPLDIWRSLRVHVTLGRNADSPVLHMMIADKISLAVTNVIEAIIEWVDVGFDAAIADEEAAEEEEKRRLEALQAGDGDERPAATSAPAATAAVVTPGKLKEVHLEFLSALANDTALHIEEVYEVIEHFDSYAASLGEDGHGIVQRVEACFDPCIALLITCGNTCLKKLSSIIISDVEAQMDQLFTDSWLADEDEDEGSDEEAAAEAEKKGQQVSIMVATVEDYCSDFLGFLNPFWSKKFIAVLLETLTVRYVRSIIFKPKRNLSAIDQVGSGITGLFNSEQRRPRSSSLLKRGLLAGPIPHRSLDGVSSHHNDDGLHVGLDHDNSDDDDDDDDDNGGGNSSRGRGASDDSLDEQEGDVIDKDWYRAEQAAKAQEKEKDKSFGGFASSFLRFGSAAGAKLSNFVSDKMHDRKDASAGHGPSTPGSDKRGGFFSDTVNRIKSTAQNAVRSGRRDEDVSRKFNGDMSNFLESVGSIELNGAAMGKIARDVNVLNGYFSKKTDQDTATEILAIVNEVLTLLALPAGALDQHAVSTIVNCPSAAIAIRETTLACMRLRNGVDFPIQKKRMALQKIELILTGAEAAAAENEEKGMAEPKLSLLYVDLVEQAIRCGALASLNVGAEGEARMSVLTRGLSNVKAATLAQKQKDSSFINLDFFKGKQNSDATSGRQSMMSAEQRKANIAAGQSEGLLTDVLESLAKGEQQRHRMLQLEDAELARAEEILKSSAGRINVKGYLTRRPKSAPGYVRNYFRLISTKNTFHAKRRGGDDDEDEMDDIDHMTFRPFTYTISWYPSSLPTAAPQYTFDTEAIHSIFLVDFPRSLRLIYLEDLEAAVPFSDVPSKYSQQVSHLADALNSAAIADSDIVAEGNEEEEEEEEDEDEAEAEIDAESKVYAVDLHSEREQQAERQAFPSLSKAAPVAAPVPAKTSQPSSSGDAAAASKGRAAADVTNRSSVSAAGKGPAPVAGPVHALANTVTAAMAAAGAAAAGAAASATGAGAAKVIPARIPVFVFCLSMLDGAKHYLRTERCDKGVRWINSIANAASMMYDRERREWNREAKILARAKIKAQALAAEASAREAKRQRRLAEQRARREAEEEEERRQRAAQEEEERRQEEAAKLEKEAQEAKRKEVFANEHAAVNDVWERQIREKEAKKQQQQKNGAAGGTTSHPPPGTAAKVDPALASKAKANAGPTSAPAPAPAPAAPVKSQSKPASSQPAPAPARVAASAVNPFDSGDDDDSDGDEGAQSASHIPPKVPQSAVSSAASKNGAHAGPPASGNSQTPTKPAAAGGGGASSSAAPSSPWMAWRN